MVPWPLTPTPLCAPARWPSASRSSSCAPRSPLHLPPGHTRPGPGPVLAVRLLDKSAQGETDKLQWPDPWAAVPEFNDLPGYFNLVRYLNNEV